MIIIDSTTVAVESSSELKTVLEGTNSYTLVYLANDITLTQGISILGSKTELTIDGLYPTDGSGTIHTYTDMNSAGSGDTIGIRTSSSINLTVQNLNVIGRNYYGIIYVSEDSSHKNVVVTYKNINYTGPQITYHPSGLSIYYDLAINIIASSVVTANEVAEAGSLKIGGKTTITHTSTSDSSFWFRGYDSEPYLEILENAEVSLNTTKDVAYTSNYLKIVVNKNASFYINTNYGFFRNNSHQASSILVDENATLSVIQNQTNGTYAMISCRGIFSVNNKATLYLQSNYTNSAPLILFNTTSSVFNINNPKSIILYNKSYNCLYFSNTSTFNITCGKIDYWDTSPALIDTGIIENNPLYSWYKSDTTNLSISASISSSKTTINTTNFTSDELQNLPSLDLLKFQTAKTLRFIENGKLELVNAPSIITFQKPIIKTDPLILGRSEKEIILSVIDSRAVSSDWYIYAYIDKPLSTQNNKYTLPESLIYINDNNEIITLKNTPTLIYSGTANTGITKTTNIEWKENTGILFKIISPIYNGETYSTLVNWILTDSKL